MTSQVSQAYSKQVPFDEKLSKSEIKVEDVSWYSRGVSYLKNNSYFKLGITAVTVAALGTLVTTVFSNNSSGLGNSSSCLEKVVKRMPQMSFDVSKNNIKSFSEVINSFKETKIDPFFEALLDGAYSKAYDIVSASNYVVQEENTHKIRHAFLNYYIWKTFKSPPRELFTDRNSYFKAEGDSFKRHKKWLSPQISAVAKEYIRKLYLQTGPVDVSFLEKPVNYIENYQSIFGSKPEQKLRMDIANALESGGRIEKHYLSGTSIEVLVDSKGEKVAVVKGSGDLLTYQFDYNHFAAVPPTVKMDNIDGKKEVILQRWVKNAMPAYIFGDAFEKDYQQFIHIIRMLDIRIGNDDRHDNNILVLEKDNHKVALPIDHDHAGQSYRSLPDTDYEKNYFKTPFSPLVKEYVFNLDIEKDAAIMKGLDYEQESILKMKVRTTLLKMALEKDLLVKEIDVLFLSFQNYFFSLCSTVKEPSEEEIRSTVENKFNEALAITTDPIKLFEWYNKNSDKYSFELRKYI